MATSQKVRVRLAPSPTGFLHIGTAQSALYNLLFAKKNGGEFLLRIEDTDRERSTKEYEKSILDALEWLGLKWDGQVTRQSARTAIYRQTIEKLLESKKAFYCRHTKEELETERKEQEEKKEPPRHLCGHKGKDLKEGIIRLANDAEQMISFDDQIRGEIKFEAKLLGDFSIAKNLDEPLYNLAVVADDAEMSITHVIRGEDHISNTPKQILIYQALGLTPPTFAHLPLILAPDRSKLSKRHGAVAVVDYKKDYLPEAILNFLGCMSYSFSKELMTMDEMMREFELAKVHKSGAVFDIKKLNWYNSQYIRKLSPAEFKKLTNLDVSDEAVALITERLERLTDAQEFSYLWMEPIYGKELLQWKNGTLDDAKKALVEVLAAMKEAEMSKNTILAELEKLSVKYGGKGPVFWPLRVALSGKEKSPDPVDIAVALGKAETLKRIEKAISLL